MSNINPFSNNLSFPSFPQLDNPTTVNDESFNFIANLVNSDLGIEVPSTEAPSLLALENLQQKAKKHIGDAKLLCCKEDNDRLLVCDYSFEQAPEVRKDKMLMKQENGKLRFITEKDNEIREKYGNSPQFYKEGPDGVIVRLKLTLGKSIEAKEMQEFERAYIAYCIATKILEIKKNKNKQKEEPATSSQASIKENTFKVKNLKEYRIREIELDDESLLNKNSKAFRVAVLANQEAEILRFRQKKDKESQELEKLIDIHQCIIKERVSIFNQKQNKIEEDVLKTSILAEEIFEKKF